MSEVVKAIAHGRVNLIGEHTDYNGGHVLPTAIPQYTEVTLKKNTTNFVTISSSLQRQASYELGKESPTDSWIDYLQGATKFLAELPGVSLSGFSAHIESNIPEGSGLSSSAALEMSFLKALKLAFNFSMSEVDMARMGQRIENDFVGARVGIMDQMATSLAHEGEALFLDTLHLTFERIHLPLDIMDLMVINSGLSHRLSSTDGGYNERRAQCEEACKLLGINQLRDITPDELEQRQLPPLLMKRAKHVVTEDQRVLKAVKAIKEKDISHLGHLFYESHKSMQEDYQVSIPEIDLLINLARKNRNVYGARLTGGGFGGSIVALTKKSFKQAIAEEMISAYEKETGGKATLLV